MIQNFNGGGLLNNYSTEEQVIGTWIDGKPIYRRTIEKNVSINANDWSTIEIATNEDVFINSFAYKRSNNFVGHFTGTRIYNGKLQVIGISITTENLYIVLEYTKTTD